MAVTCYYGISEEDLIEHASISSTKAPDPEEFVILREALAAVKEQIPKQLSPLERHVLKGHLAGKSYEEMARELHRDVKLSITP